MTHAMTSSALSRLAPLGMLLWLAAASLALPFHTSAGAPYEADGPAAHDLSLRPFGHGAHPDFERWGTQCRDAPQSTVQTSPSDVAARQTCT